jgi:hypothetical protein
MNSRTLDSLTNEERTAVFQRGTILSCGKRECEIVSIGKYQTARRNPYTIAYLYCRETDTETELPIDTERFSSCWTVVEIGTIDEQLHLIEQKYQQETT